MQYAMFVVMHRGLHPKLSRIATRIFTKEDETFATNDRFQLHQQNRYSLHRILARLTDRGDAVGQPSLSRLC
jgi:hypothetical protein